jgi:hypothetical protein
MMDVGIAEGAEVVPVVSLQYVSKVIICHAREL